MTSPLAALDALIAPIIKTALVVRQVRDSLPMPVWQLVPAQLRLPMDAMFEAIEQYERRVGLMKQAGLM